MKTLKFFALIICERNLAVVPVQLTFALQLFKPIFQNVFKISSLKKIPDRDHNVSIFFRFIVKFPCRLLAILLRRKMMEDRNAENSVEKIIFEFLGAKLRNSAGLKFEKFNIFTFIFLLGKINQSLRDIHTAVLNLFFSQQFQQASIATAKIQNIVIFSAIITDKFQTSPKMFSGLRKFLANQIIANLSFLQNFFRYFFFHKKSEAIFSYFKTQI